MKATGYAILYDVPDSEGTIYEKGCLDNVDLSSVKVTDGKIGRASCRERV